MSTDVRDILLVDDSPANLMAIEAGLGELGGRVVRAHSGEEALRCLLERDFALILLDVQMPTLDGFQTARLIRSRPRSKSTPIIFITAFDRDDEEILRAYELGAVDFLFKPLAPQVLHAKASVFVNLQEQAELIRRNEQEAHERQLAEERDRWEREALRRKMQEEREAAAEAALRADQLAATVAEVEKAKRQLTRMNDELEAVDRRKDEFLAVLAHELRNPLAPLVTHLEILSASAKNTEDARLEHAVGSMRRQVRHLNRVVDDLLDISRISSGKIQLIREDVDMTEVMEHATTLARPLLRLHRHELTVSLPEGPLYVHGDPVRLAQVIANLLNNAARYTDDGGKIGVSCSELGGQVVLVVRDTGRGLAPESLERVFEMFTQERRGGGGLGVGLALARRLVELHGGTITAESDGLDRGSTFTVRLPILDHDSPSPSAPEHDLPDEGGQAPLHVVVVEDDFDIRDAVRDLLERWGHHVELADNGPRGLDLILKSQPDVAVIDLGLPELDGCEVAQRVRQVLPKERVCLVAMTGYGQDADRRRVLEAGFDLHLVKPATARAIADALAGAQRHSTS